MRSQLLHLPNKCTIRSWSLSGSCQIRAILFKNLQLPYRLSLEGKPQTIQIDLSEYLRLMRSLEPKYTVLCHQDFSLHSFKCFVPITFHLPLSLPRLLSKYLPSIPFVFSQLSTPNSTSYAFLAVFSTMTNDRFFLSLFTLHFLACFYFFSSLVGNIIFAATGSLHLDFISKWIDWSIKDLMINFGKTTVLPPPPFLWTSPLIYWWNLNDKSPNYVDSRCSQFS